nr:hypothetical protein GCM10025732_54010 [Glycomyces mayteni]
MRNPSATGERVAPEEDGRATRGWGRRRLGGRERGWGRAGTSAVAGAARGGRGERRRRVIERRAEAERGCEAGARAAMGRVRAAGQRRAGPYPPDGWVILPATLPARTDNPGPGVVTRSGRDPCRRRQAAVHRSSRLGKGP